jgi:outer membrane protein insertion porin family
LAYLRTTYVGGEAAVTRNLWPRLPVRVGYTLEYGKTEASPALLCAAFARCDTLSQKQAQRVLPFAVTSISAQRSWANNVLDPTQGGILRGELRGSSHLFGSDPSLSFIKGTGDAIWYHGLTTGVVFAVRVRGGSIFGGATANGSALPPPQERLYAGGPTSMRGYGQNELGELIYLVQDSAKIQITHANGQTFFALFTDSTHDRVVPVGGSALAITNLDLRLRSPFLSQLLQYTLFVDGGAVKTGHIQGPDLKWAPGVGIRVNSPVGPIQLNVAYNWYAQATGALYFAAPGGGSTAPLFCVSPGNALAVSGYQPGQAGQPATWGTQAAGGCPSVYAPPSSAGLLHRLVPSLSIGTDF